MTESHLSPPLPRKRPGRRSPACLPMARCRPAPVYQEASPRGCVMPPPSTRIPAHTKMLSRWRCVARNRRYPHDFLLIIIFPFSWTASMHPRPHGGSASLSLTKTKRVQFIPLGCGYLYRRRRVLIVHSSCFLLQTPMKERLRTRTSIQPDMVE